MESQALGWEALGRWWCRQVAVARGGGCPLGTRGPSVGGVWVPWVEEQRGVSVSLTGSPVRVATEHLLRVQGQEERESPRNSHATHASSPRPAQGATDQLLHERTRE